MRDSPATKEQLKQAAAQTLDQARASSLAVWMLKMRYGRYARPGLFNWFMRRRIDFKRRHDP